MSEIAPMKKVGKVDIAKLENTGVKDACLSQLSSYQWTIKGMVEGLNKEDWMHLELNVDSIIEGLEEMRKVHKHYRKVQKVNHD